MNVRQIASIACAMFVSAASGQTPTSADFWDIAQGAVITASSAMHPSAGSSGGLFGQNGQNINDGSTWTYFADGLPTDTVHYVEWETPNDVTIGEVRVFAFGDGTLLNNGREFSRFTLKVKSPGSATYDVTVLTFIPTHPYTFIDASVFLLVDEVITPVTGRSFRAEFTQYTAGNDWDGPRVVEIDGLPVPPPPPTASDLWDISRGATITATSGLHPEAGVAAGFLGENGQTILNPSTWSYFADDKPPGFVHYIEWETPADVTVGQIRLHAFGDDNLNNGREFTQFTVKAKSPGSSSYDLTLIDFTPTHPYSFPDLESVLMLDETISPVTARHFRAEFTQYTAGFGWDGPRIVEIDAFPPTNTPPPPPLPTITKDVQSVAANFAAPVLLYVEATGTGSLQYQWFRDSIPLPGQVSDALYIPALTLAGAGVYRVSVQDDHGITFSSEATVSLDTANIRPSNADVWDSITGITITANSGLGTLGGAYGMFGAGSPSDDSGSTYFADGQPARTQHVVEWTTPTPVVVKSIRLFARGDGPALGNNHEFKHVTLKAKSPGSSRFNILIGRFAPTHPYTFLDETTFAILDAEICPIEAVAFRAEFQQYAGGPRVIELDAFATRPLVMPAIVVQPKSQTIGRHDCAQLEVVARGGNLRYQWKFNGRNIRGQTCDTLCLNGARNSVEGTYTVVVSNELGSVESAPAVIDIEKRTHPRNR